MRPPRSRSGYATDDPRPPLTQPKNAVQLPGSSFTTPGYLYCATPSRPNMRLKPSNFVGSPPTCIQHNYAPHTATQPVTLSIVEQADSPDSFRVQMLPSHDETYYVKGKLVSWIGERTLRDSRGTSLYSMYVDVAGRLQIAHLQDNVSGTKFAVRKKSFWPGFGRGKLLVWRSCTDPSYAHNQPEDENSLESPAGLVKPTEVQSLSQTGLADTSQCTNMLDLTYDRENDDNGFDWVVAFEMVCDALRGEARVIDVEKNDVQAIIRRSKLSPRKMMTGLDNYTVLVMPGVYIPFIIMMVVCFDEEYTEGIA